MEFTVEAVGLVAGFMTTCSFLPQVLKTYRSRETKDISLFMYLMFCTGVALWLVYGLYIHSVSIILANAITLVLALFVLAMKLKYG